MLTVAIVGKPNVGKSTLFNRIIGKKKSIIDDQPGVTRDRIYDNAEWLTRKFELIDTGGLENSKRDFQYNINNQVNFAIDEAKVIVFLVSHKNGIDENDRFVAKTLKKNAKGKPVILVVNKAEQDSARESANQYYSLGFGKPIFISSAHGIGIGDLLDEIIKYSDTAEVTNTDDYHFCVIGRPNVGKSSLVNAILNEERVIVSDIPGSTRDSIDSSFKYNGENFVITDTAGIRRKGKVQDNVEKYSVLRAERAIAKSNCILFMIDGSEEFKEQDEVIGGLAYKANIPTIIVVNKWDKVANKDSSTMSQMTKKIRAQFKYLAWAPIVFISAQDNKRIHTIFSTINTLRDEICKKISTSLLNDVILKAQMLQEAPIFKGNRVKISYATQVQSQIPTFVIFCNDPKYLHFSYARYIENQIRTSFDLQNVPVTLYWKSKNANTRGGNDYEK
ncbi:ribosome biogenesis GTPase Der [Ureaplasma ceti]|uniref:GTPase Der n=1 Tax=Ureaplasma ceti TaxID=3119530 RepID=A0ABP9U8L4_9BACT